MDIMYDIIQNANWKCLVHSSLLITIITLKKFIAYALTVENVRANASNKMTAF